MQRVALINDGSGNDRVHDSMCKDVARDLKEFGLHNPYGPDVIEASSVWDVASHIWGDIASDSHKSGTPEWAEQVWENDASCTKYFPCVSLPKGGPGIDLGAVEKELRLADLAIETRDAPTHDADMFMISMESANDAGVVLTAITEDGTRFRINMYGLTYGTMADFVRNNKPEEDDE